MKRKGFTLIELLAVIVILAIIALIATPTILGVIEKAGQVANISIPVHFDKKDQIELNDLNKDSKVTLNAIYVNEKGKERKIEKSLTLHVEWSAEDATEVVKQTLVRFIKYDDHKTMLSFKVEEGIENNKIPATEKTKKYKKVQKMQQKKDCT